MGHLLIALGVIVAAAAPLTAQQPSGEPDTSQDTRAVIESVLLAYGGREVVAAVTAYEMHGSLFSPMRGHGTFTRLVVRPDRLDVLIDYSGRVEVRVLQGDRGGRSAGSDPPTEVTGPLLGAMKLQAARSMVPWILEERRDEVRAISPLERGGRRFIGLQLDLEDGLVLRVYVDPETHYVVQTQGLLDVGGMRTHFETAYADHRPTDGVLFAMREANFASGVATGQTVVETITVNPEVTDSGFAPAR